MNKQKVLTINLIIIFLMYYLIPSKKLLHRLTHNQNTKQINQIQINETDAKKIEELYINLIQSKDNEIAMLKMLLVSKEEKVAVLEREISELKK